MTMINPDEIEFLIDRNEAAMILGVGPTAISNYVSRSSPHDPFPDPVIVRANGRFKLYDISSVEAWWDKTFAHRVIDSVSPWDDAITRLRTFRGDQS